MQTHLTFTQTITAERPAMAPSAPPSASAGWWGGLERPAPSAQPRRSLMVLSLLVVAVTAFVLRVLLMRQQSAFMDEGSYILSGRFLIEHGTVYADALDWTYGFYLWPLIAGAADITGGLFLVRMITAALGAVMAAATVIATVQLAPRTISPTLRWTAGLIGGLIMALAPTAIGIGRLGTYDALAAAAFMSGVAVLAVGLRTGRAPFFFLAAVLVFTGFLAKYLVALYFPFICLYLLLSPASRQVLARNLLWFIIPLTAASGAYGIIFSDELRALITHATTTSVFDLKSPNPISIYVAQRLEIWALVVLALVAWPRATRTGRLAALGGAAVMLAFHIVTRADYDWWKHSVYAVFFLAAPAALALTPVATFLVRSVLAAFGWRAATGTERTAALVGAVAIAAFQVQFWPRSDFSLPMIVVLVALALAAGLVVAPLAERLITATGGVRRGVGLRTVPIGLAAGLILPLPLGAALVESDYITTGYPNLNPALDTIRAETAGASNILTDDSIIRYYLYRENSDERIAQRVTDPFWVDYKGQRGLAGYRRAIMDRYYDAIVFTGGVGPLASQLREDLDETIDRYYERVYEWHGESGTHIEIFHPRRRVNSDTTGVLAPGSLVFNFGQGIQGWGARPENGTIEPGLQTAVSTQQTWDGQPVLEFTPLKDSNLLAVQHRGSVSKVTAQVYVEPGESAEDGARVGLFGFDQEWRWYDSGFEQEIYPGRWTELTWDLNQPRALRELGLNFDPTHTQRVSIGEIVIQP